MEEGDKKMECIDCRREFVFTKGEQQFYEDKGFSKPKRCPDCRKEARKRFAEKDGK